VKLSIRRTLDSEGHDQATEQCARRILEVVPRAMRLLREEMRQGASEGLSIPQFRVLAFLGRTPGASLSELAEFLGVAGPTASVMVQRLVERELVTRAGHPEERRRVRLGLTARGTTALERSRGRARSRVAGRIDGLSRGELETLSRGLALLEQALGGPSDEDHDDKR
jgi:DNA-binding MarR family transcriptional regulator